jgi:hypothetical protein
VLYNICQHFRVPSPDPDINEQENGGNYNFENHYDDAQNNFFLQRQRKRDAFIDT